MHQGYHLCTYFDRNYLPRGLALYWSMRQHYPNRTFWVLCLDHESYEQLNDLRLPGMKLIRLEELEYFEPRLSATRADRSLVEFYFTATPFLPAYILQQQPDISVITYLDADMFFYSSPRPLFEELGDRSIAVIEHRHPAHKQAEAAPYGRFNVGWVSFRNNTTGRACLEWWGERCLEWCYDYADQGRYGDQKYLEAWPDLFGDQVVILQHKGANVAPWNIMNYTITERNGAVYIDNDPLIFFHFHGFKQKTDWLYDTNMASKGFAPTRLIVRQIMFPYIRALRRHTTYQKRVSHGVRSTLGVTKPLQRASLTQRVIKTLKLARTILRRQQVLFFERDFGL
jgi:hypothetical protein